MCDVCDDWLCFFAKKIAQRTIFWFARYHLFARLKFPFGGRGLLFIIRGYIISMQYRPSREIIALEQSNERAKNLANETRQDTKRSQIIVMFLRSYSRSNYSMMWYVVIIINVDLFHCNQSMGKIAYQNIPMMVNHCYHHRCCCCCCCCRCVQD